MSDAVNILTNTDEVTLKPENLVSISNLKRKHWAQDQREIFGKELPKNGEACENDWTNPGFPLAVLSDGGSATEHKNTKLGYLKQKTSPELSELSNEVGNLATKQESGGLCESRVQSGNKSTNSNKLDDIIGSSKQDMVGHETAQRLDVGVNPDNNSGTEASLPSSMEAEGSDQSSGGALWDIFRREDVSKLQEYLMPPYREFGHFHCIPLQEVYNP